MTDIKLALLGSKGAGKTDSLCHKRLLIGGRQLNLEVFDPCSKHHTGSSVCTLEEPVNRVDRYVVVCSISDRASFLHAKSVLRQIKEAREEVCKGLLEVPVFLVGNKRDLCTARRVSGEEGQTLARESRCHVQEASASDDYSDISNLFTKLVRHVKEDLKQRTDRRRYSGSKSVVKPINNVFGKRRKSV